MDRSVTPNVISMVLWERFRLISIVWKIEHITESKAFVISSDTTRQDRRLQATAWWTSLEVNCFGDKCETERIALASQFLMGFSEH